MSQARKPRWAFCGLLLVTLVLTVPMSVAVAQDVGGGPAGGLADEETQVPSPPHWWTACICSQ